MTPFLVTLICGFILHVATLTLQEKIFEQTNEIRQTISKGNEQCAGDLCPPPAKPLQPFIWDNGLAYLAEKHARSCSGIGKHDDNEKAYFSWLDFCKESGASGCPGTSSKDIRRFNKLGENLGDVLGFVVDPDSTAKMMVSDWEKESKKYIWENPPGTEERKYLDDVGHWTQLAWEETNYVGCYFYDCEAKRYSQLVCKYFPPQYANKGKFVVPYEVLREEKIKSEATSRLHKATKSRATKKSGKPGVTKLREKRRRGEGPLPGPLPRAHAGKRKHKPPLRADTGLPPPPGPLPLAHAGKRKHKPPIRADTGLLPPPRPDTGLTKPRKKHARPRAVPDEKLVIDARPRAVPDEKLVIDATKLRCAGAGKRFICSYTCPAEGTTERSLFLDNPLAFETELRRLWPTLPATTGKNLETIDPRSMRDLRMVACRTRPSILIKGNWSAVEKSTRMVNLLYWNYGVLIGLYLMNVVLIIAFCGGICCVILFLMKKWFFLKE